jgi:hypothetical protein
LIAIFSDIGVANLMNAKYNYLINDSYDNFPHDFIVDNRIDPDKDDCQQLYDDLNQAFFSDCLSNEKYGIYTVENRRQKFGEKPAFFTLFVNEGEFLLSSDYIGPSVFWSKELGLSDNDIMQFLKMARTIGGHIIWPRGFSPTINKARAGARGFYDRIDWTLALIKTAYSISDNFIRSEFVTQCKSLLPEAVFEYKQNIMRFIKFFPALSNSHSWINRFNSFPEFCDFFKFRGSFVTKEYEIVELAPLFPIFPRNIELYINNTCNAIMERTRIIVS